MLLSSFSIHKLQHSQNEKVISLTQKIIGNDFKPFPILSQTDSIWYRDFKSI